MVKEKKRIELENFKLLFKSKKILENIYQNKKLCEVYDNVWLEIHQNQKGIYVCCNTAELFGAFSDIHSHTLKNCGKCTMEKCIFCEKFNYVSEQFCKVEVHKHQYPNNTWRNYLNQNEYGFELEHI